MNNFTLVYQPIVSLKSEEGYSVQGHEILARFNNQNTQDAILEMERTGRITDFDLEILKSGLEIAQSTDKEVSVNLSNSSISTEGFLERLEDAIGSQHRNNLLVEITETHEPSTKHIDRLIDFCHSRSIRVGLDDYGSGFADINLVKDHNFDFVKIDGDLTKTYDTSITSRAKVLQLSEHCQEKNIPITIEYIENTKQMMTFENLGISKGQGYLFGAPQAKFTNDQQVRANIVIQSRPQQAQEKGPQFNI